MDFNQSEKENLQFQIENSNLALIKNNNGIPKPISQRNNREEIKENSRVEQIASAIRDSYKANGKKLKRPDLEDFKKQVALKYAINNDFGKKYFIFK